MPKANKARPAERRQSRRKTPVAFDEWSLDLPSHEQLVETQRLLDEAAPLLVDREAGRLGVIGGGPAWAPVESIAQQLRTWEESLLGAIPPGLEDLSEEQVKHFADTCSAAVPKIYRERFARNFSVSAIAERLRDGRRRAVTGGQRGAGKSKRPHTELIRNAVAALSEKEVAASAANVRLLLKSGWNKLAQEWGDPLSDIVGVQVSENGPVTIEYTEKWALKHNGKRFIKLDAGALNKQIDRAKKLAAE